MKIILKITVLFFTLNISVMHAQTDDALKIDDSGNVGINTSKPTAKLEVNGDLKVSGTTTNTTIITNTKVETKTINATETIQQNGNDLLPKGAIIMWYGTTVPAGWAICDGKNETPDLRDKFVIGASETKKVNMNYGNNKITIKNLPKHDHDVIFKDEIKNKNEVISAKLMPWDTYVRNLGDGKHGSFDGKYQNGLDFKDYIKNLKTNNGNDIPEENKQEEFLPKCYALYYIMKI